MIAWFSVLVISLASCLVPAANQAAQQMGAIKGTVIDEKDIPIEKAKVRVDPKDGRPRGSLVRYAETDSSGHFVLDRLPWGEYIVSAQKEEAGYPPMNFSFYSDDVFLTVTLTPRATIADLHLRLGPKGGFLSGLVCDAISRQPVSPSIKILRARSPGKWISTGQTANFRVLIPSSTDITLEVSAPGYKTWYYSGASDSSHRRPVRLGPGEEMKLDILLSPARDKSLHPSNFFVPDGYVGWVQLEFNVEGAPPVPMDDGVKAFKFPRTGVLRTSSSGPESGAESKYFYYSENGSVRPLVFTANHSGMVWGNHDVFKGGALSQFVFFVGTEEQFKKQSPH